MPKGKPSGYSGATKSKIDQEVNRAAQREQKKPGEIARERQLAQAERTRDDFIFGTGRDKKVHNMTLRPVIMQDYDYEQDALDARVRRAQSALDRQKKVKKKS